MSQARYAVLRVVPGAVFLVDTGHEQQMSVTNDAERVVRNVLAQYGNRRIFYRDSSGDWDEILHERGTFAGFAPCPDRRAQFGGLL